MNGWAEGSSSVCECRDATIVALKKVASDSVPLHLLYVYCHHSPGAQLNEHGFRNFGDSTLFMKGISDDPITRKYLEYDSRLQGFPGGSPLVFLNACGTLLGSEY